jgi:translation initiation factor 2B subunit (eIF-2B alpha/beta/delta family)
MHVFKVLSFFRKRPGMTLDEFIDYYENQHAKLAERKHLQSSMPNALRYVRRYLTPERNHVTGEVIDPGYDCIMEIWFTSREDFDYARKVINEPGRLAATREDEEQLFATHSYSVCSVTEFDSPVGPHRRTPHVELKHED